MMNDGLEMLHFIKSKPIIYSTFLLIIVINMLVLLLLGFLIYYLINIGNSYVEDKKKFKMKRKYFLFFLVSVIIFSFVVVLYSLRVTLCKLFSPILWAIIFAYLLNPIVHMIHKRGISQTWSVFVVYTFLVMIILLFYITITPKIIRESRKLMELLPKYTNDIDEFVNTIYIKIEQLDNFSPQLSTVKETINAHLEKIQYYIIARTKDFTSGIFNIFSQIIELILIPIFTFYFLKDIDYFKNKIVFMIPKAIRAECINIFRDIDLLLNKFIRGQLVVAACVGSLSIIALLIINVNFAFLIGMIAGIFDIIPYFGPILGAIPAFLIALLDEPSKAFWVVVSFFIIQQVESAIITPKIVGESVGLHPVTVILSLLIGSEWLGIVGLLFAVPIAASIKIVSKHILDLIIKP